MSVPRQLDEEESAVVCRATEASAFDELIADYYEAGFGSREEKAARSRLVGRRDPRNRSADPRRVDRRLCQDRKLDGEEC